MTRFCHTPGRNNENSVDRVRNHALFPQHRLVEMKHLFPRRGISFLEQVSHRPVPASLDVALSHPGARSVDALRLDVGDHGPPGNVHGACGGRIPVTVSDF